MRGQKVEFAVTCCFTGHRMIRKIDKDKIVIKLEKTVDELIERGIKHFICGGALGFDTLAAQVVLEKRKTHDIMLELAIPCRDQAARWSQKQKEIYDGIVAQADKCTYLFERYITGCMHFRDAFMVDNSDILVAYYRGTPGGTQYTYLYAENRGLEVINI